MKIYIANILYILLIFSTTTAFAQFEILKGTWVTPEQDLVEIVNTGRTSSNCLSNTLLHEEHFRLFIFGDTLSFQNIYTSSLTQFKIEYIDRYDLKIVTYSDSILVVRPVSELSKTYFQGRSMLRFVNKKYLVNDAIVFEKLIYHATRSWNGPTVDLELDSSRNLYMTYRNNSGLLKNGLASGNYSTVLDDSTYKELIDEIKNCSLETLRFGRIDGADASVITLIVYFNCRRKYLQSMFPPRISGGLLNFIRSRLQSYVKLMPTVERKELER